MMCLKYDFMSQERQSPCQRTLKLKSNKNVKNTSKSNQGCETTSQEDTIKVSKLRILSIICLG